MADRATAEDVVQETWMAVIRGIDRFDGRSALKTWIFRMLVNRAKTIGQRAARVVPISSLIEVSERDDGAGEATSVFDHPRRRTSNHWSDQAGRWAEVPEDRVTATEAVEVVRGAIAALPAAQRTVITLRDLECWDAKQVCGVLGLSETNQRVILHRARSRVRRRLCELDELTGDERTA